jgi:hypothetical protein
VLALVVYGFFTQPLPFGLSGVVRNPGAGAGTTASSGASGTAVSAAARTSAGQPLSLGAVSVVVEGVQRNQDLASSPGRGPAGSFTILMLQVRNAGNEPVTLRPADFRLADDRGRAYAVDVEATRAAAQVAKRRAPFETSVPPGSRLATVLAFESASDSQNLSLRVTLGYGELELPR